jgi:hypothetical protein
MTQVPVKDICMITLNAMQINVISAHGGTNEMWRGVMMCAGSFPTMPSRLHAVPHA